MRKGGIVSSAILIARYVVPQMTQTGGPGDPGVACGDGGARGHDEGGLNSTRSRSADTW